MADYISREKAIRTILFNGLMEKFFKQECTVRTVRDIMDSVPKEDVEPVVHCYSCKHFKQNNICYKLFRTTDKDFFCGYGEKKGGAGLKPCPFCGSPADFVDGSYNEEQPFWWVKCSCCGAESDGSGCKDDAAKQWNQRLPHGD